MTDHTAAIGSDGFAIAEGFLPIYHYDAYGAYTNSDSHYFCVGVGVPARATVTEPPAAPSGKVAVWSGSAWSLEPDFRGQTWYAVADGSPAVIVQPGAPAAGTYSSTPIAGSSYLKAQASAALAWCGNQQNAATLAGAIMSADMKAYAQKLLAIINGTDTASTALPAQPTDIMT